eukprot:5604015-Alexandrium_andersonii.AAC.1
MALEGAEGLLELLALHVEREDAGVAWPAGLEESPPANAGISQGGFRSRAWGRCPPPRCSASRGARSSAR